MDVKIRKAEISDIDALVRLMDYLLSLEGDFPNQEAQQRTGFRMVIESNASEIFVAELDGNIVGMCCLHRHISTVQGGYTGVVEDVVVDREFAEMGIAGMMLAYLENYAKKAGMTRLQLMVDRDNIPAVSLYKKHHWTETKYIGFRKYI